MSKKTEKENIIDFLKKEFITNRINNPEEFEKWFSGYLKNYIYNNKINYRDGEFKEKLNHIIDYLISPRGKKRFDRMTFEEAEKQTNKWSKWLKKRISEGDDPEHVKELFLLKNNWKAVSLHSAKALSYEGSVMQHCVGGGSYNDRVFDNRISIISLRDENDNPHATIEINNKNNTIVQIQGKNNKALNQKYVSILVDYIKKSKIPFENINKHSLDKNQLITFNNKIYHYKNSEHKANIIFSNIDNKFIKMKELFLTKEITQYLPENKELNVSGEFEDFSFDGEKCNININGLSAKTISLTGNNNFLDLNNIHSKNIEINGAEIKLFSNINANQIKLGHNINCLNSSQNNIKNIYFFDKTVESIFESINKNELKSVKEFKNGCFCNYILNNIEEYPKIEQMNFSLENNIEINNQNRPELKMVIRNNLNKNQSIKITSSNIKDLIISSRTNISLFIKDSNIFKLNTDSRVEIMNYENSQCFDMKVGHNSLEKILKESDKKKLLKVTTRRKKGEKRRL